MNKSNVLGFLDVVNHPHKGTLVDLLFNDKELVDGAERILTKNHHPPPLR